MASQTEQFLARYSAALDNRQVYQMETFHILPSVFVTDKHKKVCSLAGELVAVYSRLFSNLEQYGVQRHEVQLNQAMRLSDSITFATAQWSLFDQQDELIEKIVCSYTLQNGGRSEPRIIVAVLDDKAQVYSQLLSA